MPVKPKLLIISDTAMWSTPAGVAVFEPTLREIESLGPLFEAIVWMGYNFGTDAKGYARTSLVNNLSFVLLPKATGGETIIGKFRIIPFLPLISWKVWRAIRRYEYIHTRGPSVPALIAILYSLVRHQKKFWHKYAGSWVNKSPFFYSLQKKLLLRATSTKVTVNGFGSGAPSHVISLINPCLSRAELVAAREAGRGKKFDGALRLCFVGRLEEAKGLGNLMRALASIRDKGRIEKIILAGEGDRQHYQRLADPTGIRFEFAGLLGRGELNHVYASSHLLLLPSKSEGFPKVVSEAMAFGCLPVVTDVSMIREHVHDGENGFLLRDNSEQTIRAKLDEIMSRSDLDRLSNAAMEAAGKFDYDIFVQRITREVFHLEN